MFPSVLIVVRVLAKTGVSPPFACASNSYWSPPQNISSRSNISQPQSVSGPITATQRHRVQPDRAATSADMNLSEPRISTDNIARRPRCREPPNCLALKTANPDREIDLFALLDQVLPFFLSFFVSTLYLPRLVWWSPGRGKLSSLLKYSKNETLFALSAGNSKSASLRRNIPDVDVQHL